MTPQIGVPPMVETRPLIRFIAFGLVIVLMASLLLIRLFALQVSASAQYTALANQNRTVLQALPSTRGLIFDRHGKPLVTNVASYSVKIRPADLPESRRVEVLNALAELLHKDPTDLTIALDENPGSRYDLVRVASDVNPTIADFIAESSQDLPGVQVVVETRREYTYGPLLAQMLGYTGPINGQELTDLKDKGYLPDDLIGRAGVEAVYEDQLRGQYGLETVERDAGGRRLQVLQTNQQPVPGSSLRLSIDLHIQKLAQKAVDWGMRRSGVHRAAFIVMNPQTGEILAMVSMPTYDDNLFAEGISTKDFQKLASNKNMPLLNHAVANQYAPGSTFKMITAIAALADGKLDPNEYLRTAGAVYLGGTRFVDWNGAGFGLCNLVCGFEHSSDTYFYQVAARVGIDRLSHYAHMLGLGAPTGIDLPGEAAGIIPSNKWKIDMFGEPIYPGEVYMAGIGQGYDALSPLQLLNAYASVINGGTVHEPRVVRNIIDPDGTVRRFKPVVTRKLDVDPWILRTMRKNARHVVLSGHTWNLRDLPIVVAGKTGQAEFGVPKANGYLNFHWWFVGWVPKHPRIQPGDPTGLKAVARKDAKLAFVSLSYQANTAGNMSTEIAKYFLQMYYGIKHDYRLPWLLNKAIGYRQD